EAAPPRRALRSFPTRRSSDLQTNAGLAVIDALVAKGLARKSTVRIERTRPSPSASEEENPRWRSGSDAAAIDLNPDQLGAWAPRSEEHTSELQSRVDLVCRLL